MAEIRLGEDGLETRPVVPAARWRSDPTVEGYYWRSNSHDIDYPMVLIYYAGSSIYWILTDIWNFNVEVEEFRIDMNRHRERGDISFYGPLETPTRESLDGGGLTLTGGRTFVIDQPAAEILHVQATPIRAEFLVEPTEITYEDAEAPVRVEDDEAPIQEPAEDGTTLVADD